MKPALYVISTLDGSETRQYPAASLGAARKTAVAMAKQCKSAVLLRWTGWHRVEYVQPDGTVSMLYHHGGALGCVDQWKSPDTGTLVGLYHGVQAGIDGSRWCTVCEAHGSFVGHATLVAARRTRSPKEFCDDCRQNADGEGDES